MDLRKFLTEPLNKGEVTLKFMIAMFVLSAVVIWSAPPVIAATTSASSLAGWDVVSDPNNPQERILMKEFTQAASSPTALALSVPEFDLGPYNWRLDNALIWYNNSTADTEWVIVTDYSDADTDGDGNIDEISATLANAVEDSQVRVRLYSWRGIS